MTWSRWTTILTLKCFSSFCTAEHFKKLKTHSLTIRSSTTNQKKLDPHLILPKSHPNPHLPPHSPAISARNIPRLSTAIVSPPNLRAENQLRSRRGLSRRLLGILLADSTLLVGHCQCVSSCNIRNESDRKKSPQQPRLEGKKNQKALDEMSLSLSKEFSSLAMTFFVVAAPFMRKVSARCVCSHSQRPSRAATQETRS